MLSLAEGRSGYCIGGFWQTNPSQPLPGLHQCRPSRAKTTRLGESGHRTPRMVVIRLTSALAFIQLKRLGLALAER